MRKFFQVGFLLTIGIVVACSRRPTSSDPQAVAETTYHGRRIAPTMSFLGAEWLEREDRVETERPDEVIAALKIPEGAVVADIGAGTGFFTLRLARRVGASGKVIATDLQPEMLALLRQHAGEAGLANIEPVLCTERDAKLPVDAVDLALMVDVYHELSHPEETMAQVRRALRAKGRLVLVEYRGEDPSVPIKPEHKMTLAQLKSELEPMGFRLQETLEFLPQQHLVVFVKAEN